MKHIKHDFISKAASDSLGGLRIGAEAKITLFQDMVMLHIKLKGMMHAATW